MDGSIAPMVVFTTGIVTTGAVLILRPIAKRLGDLLEALTEARRRPLAAPELTQIRELLTNIDSRLNLLEERQEFAEALLASGERSLPSQLPPPPN